jgi:hypothetical protein
MASAAPRSFAISAGRQRAGRQRQAGALAGEAGGAGLVGDLHLGLLRDRAQRTGGGALELLLAGLVLAHPGVPIIRLTA